MKEIYIIETSTQPGFWDVYGKTAYVSKKAAYDEAIRIMEVTDKKIAARVTSLNIE